MSAGLRDLERSGFAIRAGRSLGEIIEGYSWWLVLAPHASIVVALVAVRLIWA